ncbi:uncharacterized protein VICG_00430 [Vittaforma corneae ATCC 50505]|uniref:BRCA2 OB1 domain-containing protein n=1 Tax=Vittaforma corneae (strain ATCC 50505) TaxID=993615 RepID=L2GP66_VITCO|nr:uncharacterized protein VICG_00430 [Vittaforma corneae ATCC 50505]ELA42678.1 hypothetical protein VICG_00430 [Vittaforma corneae ATCC 50505]
MEPSRIENSIISKNSDVSASEANIYTSDCCINVGSEIGEIFSEVFHADPCISDIEHLCTDSMREYEEYVETENPKSEKEIFGGMASSESNEENVQVTESSFDYESSKENFSFVEISHEENSRSVINNSIDAPSVVHDSYNTESDLTAKRYKSSTSSISCQDINRSNSTASFTLDNNRQAFSGFKNGKDQEIYIDPSKIETAMANLDSQEKNECTSKFIKDLISSLPSTSQDTTVSDEEIVTQVVEDDLFESTELNKVIDFDSPSIRADNNNQPNEKHKLISDIESYSCKGKNDIINRSNDDKYKLENITGKIIDSGFTTGNNKNVLVNSKNIKHMDLYYEEDQENAKSKNCMKSKTNSNTTGQMENEIFVESAFMTGKNQTILIDLKNLKTTENQTMLIDADDDSLQINHDKLSKNDSIVSIGNNANSTFSKNQFMKKCSISRQKDVCSRITEDLSLAETFSKVLRHFKKEEHSWIFEQFKWTWLHLYLNNEIGDNESTLEKIIEIMILRQKYEKSILRRIVEFDDVPFRFMVLGLIDYSEECAELFDGFYSLKFRIDKNIYTLLRNSECTLGSKLFVFGSAILLKGATSIFDIQGTPLRLFYNSVKVCHGDYKLGAAKKISFLNTISAILPDGGVVSGLNARIKQILEFKYLVAVENYKNRVDDLEKEIEKIYEIAGKTGYRVRVEDISVRQYCKLLIEDETGECYLTWWNPPEVHVGERYKFVFLNTIERACELHLTTTKKTYTEKVKI